MRLGWRTGGPFRWAFSGRYGDGRRRRCAGLRVGADLGRYRLIEPLGRGGMAEVWKARTSGPSGFEHDVVIKRIQPAHGADPEFIQLFVEEARISAMLHHANIVQVHDFVDEGGDLYLVLEYVEGPSLSRALRALRSVGRSDAAARSPPGSRARSAARSTTCTRSPTARGSRWRSSTAT